MALRGPTWEKFVRAVTSTGDGRWVYRGQADASWPLLPSAGRRNVFGTSYSLNKEQRLFREFRREAPRWERHLSTDLEYMALGQHYGLPTRLLDWSTNPLIAAWFACTGEPAADGKLHMLRVPRYRGVTDDHPALNPYSLTSTTPILVRVPPNVARITAQQGLFSLHPDPVAPWVPGVPFLHRTLTISSIEKPYFLQMLNILGVNHARLMVDLAGHCATLAWQYKIWP